MNAADADRVREHLVRCTKCRSAVSEIESTLDVLRNAHLAESPTADRLTEQHRARIVRALTHPFLDWLERHHVAVSLAIAVIVILVLAIHLHRYRPWDPEKRGSYALEIFF